MFTKFHVSTIPVALIHKIPLCININTPYIKCSAMHGCMPTLAAYSSTCSSYIMLSDDSGLFSIAIASFVAS